MRALLAALVLAGSATAEEASVPTPFPAGSIERCVRGFHEGFLDDPAAVWSAGISTSAAASIAVPFRSYRRCLELSGDPSGANQVPARLRDLVPGRPVGDGDLHEFHRACKEGGYGPALAPCKRVLKAAAGDYLREDANWDALCAVWCAGFVDKDPGACDKAVAEFASDQVRFPNAVAALCLDQSGLAVSCEGSEPDRRGICEERRALAGAIRDGTAEGCPDALRPACGETLLAPGACARRHQLEVAFAVCKSRVAAGLLPP